MLCFCATCMGWLSLGTVGGGDDYQWVWGQIYILMQLSSGETMHVSTHRWLMSYHTSCLPATSEVGFTDVCGADVICTVCWGVRWMGSGRGGRHVVNNRSVRYKFHISCRGWLHNNSASLPSSKIWHLFNIPSLLINFVLHILCRDWYTSTMLIQYIYSGQ